MFCSQHRPLSSCFDRHMGPSEFALSLVTCAQLSSWARTANTHGNIGCAFYASTAAQNTPEQVKEAQIQPRASQIQPRAAQIKPKPSQIKAKPTKIKSRTIQISKYQANSDRHHQLADLDEHTSFTGRRFHTTPFFRTLRGKIGRPGLEFDGPEVQFSIFLNVSLST